MFCSHHFVLIIKSKSSPILYTLTSRSLCFLLYQFLVILFLSVLISCSFLHSFHKFPQFFILRFSALGLHSLYTHLSLSLLSPPILPLLSPLLDNHHLNILSLPPSLSMYLFIDLSVLSGQSLNGMDHRGIC